MGEGSWLCSKNTPQQSGYCCSPLCSTVLPVLISPRGINSSSWRRAQSRFSILVVVAALSCDGKGTRLGCSLGKQPLHGEPRAGHCCPPAKGEGVGKKMQLWDSGSDGGGGRCDLDSSNMSEVVTEKRPIDCSVHCEIEQEGIGLICSREDQG